MPAKRASANRKRKRSPHTGSRSGGGWVLYPLAVLIGMSAGVAYYFMTAPPVGKPVGAARPITAAAPAAARQRPRTKRPVRNDDADAPSVNVRTVSPDKAAAPPTAATPAAKATAAAPYTGEPLPPTEIEKGAGARPEVSLTFDAGSDWKPTKQILEALAAQNVKATFFLTGEWVQQNPKTTRLIADQGHEIGNHSWDHPPFTKLADDAIRDQLRRTETIIQDTVGKSSRPYFRPPLGDRDPRVRSIVGEEGFLTVYWTLDSRDSVDRGITAAQIRERVLGKTAAGSIILLHCGSQATADALPAILAGLKTRGLNQVPVSRLLQE
ncbi:MAG: polysaccharide deacetylase family protein [Actinomycetota bacterium]